MTVSGSIYSMLMAILEDAAMCTSSYTRRLYTTVRRLESVHPPKFFRFYNVLRSYILLYHSCNKCCNLIGQQQVSKSH